MASHSKILYLFLGLSWCKPHIYADIDVRIYGTANKVDALGSIALDMIDILKDNYSLEFQSLSKRQHHNNASMLSGVSEQVHEIVSRGSSNEHARVALMTHLFMHHTKHPLYQDMKRADIKLAISMFETNRIPMGWVDIINNVFDAVIVPDKFLVEVYHASGVKKPIFVIPLPMDLEKFLAYEPTDAHTPFTFGSISAFYEKKNHIRVLQAFAEEFGRNKDVQLILHGHYANPRIFNELTQCIKHYHLQNVRIDYKKIDPKEYVDFFSKIDCYVLASRGEGFSKTPREALALGIPCILSKNTAHKTLCKSKFVSAIPSHISKPAYIEAFHRIVGQNFDCRVKDIRRAMRDVYQNYKKHKKRALKGRKWVKGYSISSIAPFFRSMVKPSKVILGSKNRVTKDSVMTSDEELFKKYIKLINRTAP